VSLLDTASEDVVVYLEEVTTDALGNTRTRPSATGVPTKARIQPMDEESTESWDGGYLTSSRYGLRFPRSWPHVLGAQSQVEWRGKRWAIEGDPIVHNGSPRTRHIQYQMVRR
jgi:hypothetical protein